MKKAYGSITDIYQNKNFYLYYYLKNMNCDFQKYITYFNSYVLWWKTEYVMLYYT